MKKVLLATGILGILILISLAPGCGAEYFKLMAHPDGRTVECRAYHGDYWDKVTLVNKCVESYEKLGFKEVK